VRTHRLEREQVVTSPLTEAFDFFSRTSNLERITPPWLRFGHYRQAAVAQILG
jgi:ligand-binding SRPBCC domain-containing protein